MSKKNTSEAGGPSANKAAVRGRPSLDCSLARWPSVEEVRAHYLTPGTGWAYALVRGFSDYGPVVAKFYITRGLVDDEEVFVDFPVAPSLIPVEMLDQQDGFTVEFLCLANVDVMTRPQDSEPKPQL